MTAIINAEGLIFNYETSTGTVYALKGIDLEVLPGEYIAVIGPNGSGKSTLIKHFNALLTPARGEVRVGGLSVRENLNTEIIRQTCGMVFQNPDNQIVATTVEEDVAFGPENMGLASEEIKKRVENAMKTTGILNMAVSAPHLLSGGQKQRVAIAGILAMQPRCLLLDEPTSLLDPTGQQEIMNLIRKLNRDDGLTVIHVTHSMEEAAEADRVLIMYDGQIVHDGPPEESLSKVSRLREWNLEAPLAARLAEKLRISGIPVPRGIIKIDKLVDILCS